MSEGVGPQGSSPLEKVVGRGGPIVGSITGIVGTLLVLFGFVLPWASCGSYRLSGLDIVIQSASGNINSGGTLLCLIPLLAIGLLGVAVTVIPATLWKKIPSLVKAIGTALMGLLAMLACCPSCLFFTNMQSARNDPNSFGMGGFLQVEYGFWVTVFGLFASFLGGLLGAGSSLAEVLMSRKKPSV